MSENVRFWTDRQGYEFVRADNTHLIAHHRLLAYAWGIIEDIDTPEEVDHITEVQWLNTESNLQAVEPSEHGSITRRRAYLRQEEPQQYHRARTDGGYL